MFAIYRNQCGKPFIGVVAKTEEEAWAYLNKKYGRTINGVHYGCNRNGYIIKKVVLV